MRLDVEVLAGGQQHADDRLAVTLGRAAQMLRMSRQAVLKYAHAGELDGEWIEGAHVARGVRSMQLVFTKGEVRRFRQLLEDRRRRRPSRDAQLALPLASTTPAKPQPWRWAAFTPRMLKAVMPTGGCRSTTWTREKTQRSRGIA